MKRIVLCLIVLTISRCDYALGLGFSHNPVALLFEWFLRPSTMVTGTENMDQQEPKLMTIEFPQNNDGTETINPEWKDEKICAEIAALIDEENIEALKKFINKDNVNQRHMYNGQTWLFYVAGHGNEYTNKVLKFFIGLGADVNIKDNDGFIPLQYVNTLYKTKLLLDYTTDKVNLERGFRTAVRSGDIHRVRLFLKYGAQIDKMIFEQAMYIKDVKAAKGVFYYLLAKDKNKTDLNICNEQEYSDTLLNKVIRYDNFDLPVGRELAKILIMNPAVDVNAKGMWGYTPLHCAAERGIEELFMVLLKRGANINEKNDEGLTPLDLASKYYHFELFYEAQRLGAKRASEL